MTAISLLEIPNINSGSIAQQTYDVCNEVKEAFLLDWNNFVVFSSDNTNSIIGNITVSFKKYEMHKVTK